MTNYIQLAIPFFFVAILLESLYSGLNKKGWVNWQDAFANLACGSVEQIFELSYKSIMTKKYLRENPVFLALLCICKFVIKYYRIGLRPKQGLIIFPFT